MSEYGHMCIYSDKKLTAHANSQRFAFSQNDQEAEIQDVVNKEAWFSVVGGTREKANGINSN